MKEVRNLDEAQASWNTVYHAKEGFECQITLRDEDEAALETRAKKTMVGILKSGGVPLRRRSYVPEENHGNSEEEERPEKTYLDEDGERRCNLKLKNGRTCGSPVTERQGKYGPFWSCPNYKEHAA
ncbi:MAG: hypothetical protein HYX78_01965 [Armatimonadetes bacterium]|nr:hypothetical protein [Armatimonadota bacterium]